MESDSDSTRPELPGSSKSKSKSKLVRRIRELVHRQPTTAPSPNCANILNLKLKSQARPAGDGGDVWNRTAALEALAAKLFAGVSSVKAAYAEIQLAQSPYDGDAIREADEAVVKELKHLSELKRGFMRKEPDPCPPHVTLMLSQIQEQQSVLRTYEISLKTLQAQKQRRDSDLAALRSRLQACVAHNQSLLGKQVVTDSDASASTDNLRLPHTTRLITPTHFVRVLQYAVKSIRAFVESMIHEMESANWDLHAAASAIHRGVEFANPTHRCFAFESFVTRELFQGFDSPNFSPSPPQIRCSEGFEEARSADPKALAAGSAGFAAFLRAKYMKMVHPKMECSLLGNLRQRNLVASGEWSDTAFFAAFAEMARRTWMLHCLARWFEEGGAAMSVALFQVKKRCRFSEVFMECVNGGEISRSVAGDTLRVAFTVLPGFKIGKTVVQCQVYVSPAT